MRQRTGRGLLHREGHQAKDMFAPHAKHLAAGGKNLQPGQRGEESTQQRRQPLDDMFAVVHEQQRRPPFEALDHGFLDVRHTASHAGGARHGRQHVVLRGQRREIDEADLGVRRPFRITRGHADGNAGLAHAAGSGDRDQPARRKHAEQALDLRLASHEPGEASGQPGRRVPQRRVGYLRHGSGRHELAVHSPQEAVAAQWDVGDPFQAPVLSAGPTQGLAQDRHMDSHARLLDHRVRPDRREQLVLADHFAGATHERDQQSEGTRSEPH
ncbi:hypothetical protein D3C71_639770 [compost metagenome]